MQSRRTWLPEVSEPTSFSAVAALPQAAITDRGGVPPTLSQPVLLVGPEGGWADDERGAGLRSVALGPQVLRAETAAVAAGVLLSALREGLVGPVAE